MAYANKLWNMFILRSSCVRFSGNKIHPKIQHIDFVNSGLGISFQLRVLDVVSRTETSNMFSDKDVEDAATSCRGLMRLTKGQIISKM